MAALVVMGILSGCQPTFLAKDTFIDANASLPAKLEQDHLPPTGPLSVMTKAPPTVNQPERKPRELTLQLAFAIALENGSVSSRAGAGAGLADDTGASATPGGGSLTVNQTEKIKVLALYPAISHAAMEASLSRFDTLFVNGVSWSATDQLAQGLQNFTNGHSASVYAGFAKPLTTGGFASVMFINSYQNLTTPPTGAFSTINPQYASRLVFGIEQPIMRDWGVFINQLLPRFPSPTGQSINPNSSQVLGAVNNRQGQLSSFVDRNTEGILISRLRLDQQRAEFERNVHILIVTTEVAYWNLYSKYGQLYSAEENLRILHTIWQEAHNRFKQGSMPPEAYYQILGQYEEFRAERIRSLNEVLEAERNLRGIIGLPVDDGERLVPITPPTFMELRPNWELALQDALNLRPELQLARDNLKYHQYLLSIQKNLLRPDLRAHIRYEPNGLGSTLTGNGEFVDGTGTLRPTNAFRSLAGGHFADYTIGLSLSMPLGYRHELAAIRAARLELTQSYLFLRDQEDRATRFLAKHYQEVAHEYKRIETHHAERVAYGTSLGVLFDKKAKGQISFITKEGQPTPFLEIQRRYAAALIKEYTAIAEYNNALARLEWAKGTILRYNNIQINEGALPQAAQVRAVEYEKERSKSFVLRTRPDSLTQPGRLVDAARAETPGLTGTPGLQEYLVPPLPTAENNGKLPAAPRRLDPLPTVPVDRGVEQIDWKPAQPKKTPGVVPASVAPVPGVTLQNAPDAGTKIAPLPTIFNPGASGTSGAVELNIITAPGSESGAPSAASTPARMPIGGPPPDFPPR